MMFRILAFLLLPGICLAQVNSNGEKPTGELLSNEISPNDMKRNASFNLDEIKVRWKKAALENCTGVPCTSFSAPGPVTNIVASVTSPTSVRVTFGEPASNGGSPITGYEATATPTSSAPAKRKFSATITVKGDKSPIDIPGLTTGQNYIFTVVALNAAGGSPPTVTVTPVTPCTLNTPAVLNIQDLIVGVNIAIGFNTTGATGIGTATGLPDGMSANWEDGLLVIRGIPIVAGTFDVRIPLTGGCGSVEAKGKITVGAAPPLCVLAGNDGIIIPSGTLLGEGLLIGTTPLGVTSIIYNGGLPLNTTIVWSEGQLYLKGQPTSVQTEPFTFFFILKGGVCDNKEASGKFLLEVMP
jgi:hypothetical protein